MNDEDLQKAMDKLPKEYVFGGMDYHDGWDELTDEERELVEGQIKDVIQKASKEADRNNSCRGCGSKIGASVLSQALEGVGMLDLANHPEDAALISSIRMLIMPSDKAFP